MGKYNVLVASDTHCGSIYGLLPPGFVTHDGREIKPNVGQQYLWDCWEDLCSRVSKLKIHALVFNGDCIDGKQRKTEGWELCLNQCSEQAEAATIVANTLRKACGNCPVYVIKGTPYHSGVGGDEEQRFAEKIGAKRAVEFLDLSIDGVVINFLHGIGVGGGLYRETAPGREGVWSALAGKQGRALKADCLVRAHGHYFIHIEHADKHIVINPCWQLQTSYARKNSMYRMLPEIGNTMIEIDPDAKRIGKDPINITKFLYKLPEMKATKLAI